MGSCNTYMDYSQQQWWAQSPWCCSCMLQTVEIRNMIFRWGTFQPGLFLQLVCLQTLTKRSGGLGLRRSGGSSLTLCWLSDGCVPTPHPYPSHLSLLAGLMNKLITPALTQKKGGQYIFWVDSQQKKSPLLLPQYSSLRLCNAGGSAPVFFTDEPRRRPHWDPLQDAVTAADTDKFFLSSEPRLSPLPSCHHSAVIRLKRVRGPRRVW